MSSLVEMGVLAVDCSCSRCSGTGIIDRRELIPGEQPRFGGPPQFTVLRRELCACVRAVNVLAIKDRGDE
jgi:hypothetical protein